MASNENKDYSRLKELSESNYEIVDGQPDIQGWDIENSKGVKIGEVDDLLFDPELKKVRYIVLDTENNDLNLEDGHVLIPIGVAELHEEDDTVLIPNVTVEQLTALPIYEKGREITPETEAEIRNVFIKPDTEIVTDSDFYEHEHFNETKFYGKRKPTVADDNLITEGDKHLLKEGGEHLLTEGEQETPSPNSVERQKYNRDNIIP
jgi:sporulation protein YlmC with PRC-barrel domain